MVSYIHISRKLQWIMELEEEMNNTLGYSKYDYTNKNTDNSRNGHIVNHANFARKYGVAAFNNSGKYKLTDYTKKTVKSQFGKIELDIPRDADGEHEPIIVKKHERTISSDLEGMIVSLFSQGLSNRDIGSHMNKIYGLEGTVSFSSDFQDSINTDRCKFKAADA